MLIWVSIDCNTVVLCCSNSRMTDFNSCSKSFCLTFKLFNSWSFFCSSRIFSCSICSSFFSTATWSKKHCYHNYWFPFEPNKTIYRYQQIHYSMRVMSANSHTCNPWQFKRSSSPKISFDIVESAQTSI